MILCNDDLRIALVTTHLPIKDVPTAITKDAILEKISIFNESLTKDFDILKPRIAVLALNPHAGDNGLIGTEERDIIAPAIEEAYTNKILAFGPYAADGFLEPSNTSTSMACSPCTTTKAWHHSRPLPWATA